MSSQFRLFVIPDCKLEIEIQKEDKHSHLQHGRSNNKPLKYKIQATQKFFKFKDDSNNDRVFEGVLSPTQKVNLSFAARRESGIPKSAVRYAFMHPPRKLASLLDWKEQKATFKKEAEDEVNIQEGKTHAIISGAFVYLDKNMEPVAVNALSLVETKNEFKFTGPWRMKNTAIHSMKELKRFQTFEIDIYEEAGFASLAWIRADETFQSKPAFGGKNHCPYGAFAILREDGKGLCYDIMGNAANNSFHHRREEVDIFLDCIECVKDSFLEKDYLPFNANIRGLVTSQFSLVPNDDNLVSDSRKKISSVGGEAFGEDSPITRIIQKLRAKLKDRDIPDKIIIHKACQAGMDRNIVEGIVDELGIDKLKIENNGWTPLHYACRFSPESSNLIEYLLEKYPEAAKIPDQFGRLPLHLACAGGAKLETISTLLSANKDSVIKETSYLKMGPLHFACNYGASFEVIKALIDKDDKSLQIISSTGRLPLHMAVEKRMSSEVIKLLLEKGPRNDVMQWFRGFLPIHIACLNGSEKETVEYLLEKDQQKESRVSMVDVTRLLEHNITPTKGENETNCCSMKFDGMKGMTPLHLALTCTSMDPEIVKRKGDIIELLLAEEKNKEERKNNSFHKDISKSMNNTVELASESKKKTVLHLACENINVGPEVIQALLDLDPQGQTLFLQDSDGMTALHYACSRKAPLELIEKLLENDVDRRLIDAANNRGRTALHVACIKGASLEVINALLEILDFETIQKRDKIYERNALHYACENDASADVLEAIIMHNEPNYGDITSMKDANGRMPFDMIPDESNFKNLHILHEHLQKHDRTASSYPSGLFTSILNLPDENQADFMNQPYLRKALNKEMVKPISLFILFFDVAVQVLVTYLFSFTIDNEERILSNWTFILFILCLGWMLFREYLQLEHATMLVYFSDAFNTVDLAQIGLIVSVLCIHMNRKEGIDRNLLAACVAVAWTRFIFVTSHLNYSVNILVTALVAVTKELVPFLYVVVIISFAFAHMYYIIQTVSNDPCDNNGQTCSLGYWYFNALTTSLSGDWSFFENFTDSLSVVSVAFALIMGVVLMNMVIALISNIFTDVSNESETSFWVSRLRLIEDVKSMKEFLPSEAFSFLIERSAMPSRISMRKYDKEDALQWKMIDIKHGEVLDWYWEKNECSPHTPSFLNRITSFLEITIWSEIIFMSGDFRLYLMGYSWVDRKELRLHQHVIAWIGCISLVCILLLLGIVSFPLGLVTGGYFWPRELKELLFCGDDLKEVKVNG